MNQLFLALIRVSASVKQFGVEWITMVNYAAYLTF